VPDDDLIKNPRPEVERSGIDTPTKLVLLDGGVYLGVQEGHIRQGCSRLSNLPKRYHYGFG
jgi:hypothetical protein